MKLGVVNLMISSRKLKLPSKMDGNAAAVFTYLVVRLLNDLVVKLCLNAVFHHTQNKSETPSIIFCMAVLNRSDSMGRFHSTYQRLTVSKKSNGDFVIKSYIDLFSRRCYIYISNCFKFYVRILGY